MKVTYESYYGFLMRGWNKWFSDAWVDIRGTTQKMNVSTGKQNMLRGRSAAFTLELPYNLINMFSILGDTVLDPFWGTGTTSLATMISARNSIGFEIHSEFLEVFKKNVKKIKNLTNSINENRLLRHIDFIKRHTKEGKDAKYMAINYKFPVITQQERGILLYSIKEYRENKNNFIVNHEKFEFEPRNKLIQSQLTL